MQGTLPTELIVTSGTSLANGNAIQTISVLLLHLVQSCTSGVGAQVQSALRCVRQGKDQRGPGEELSEVGHFPVLKVLRYLQGDLRLSSERLRASERSSSRLLNQREDVEAL